ncbi:MAG: M67 family metallopeptidase [Gemmataceae bacterium]|nr:M67 family metallopeptidase [Gemmataceae bacterium]
MSTFFRLLIPRRFHDAMLLAARSELPLECCGLLAGRVAAGVGRVIEHYPLVNALASPREYESEPASMFRAVRDMRRRGIDILAVYHSHPTSPPIPSRLDLERRYSNDVVHLIISLATAPPELRGWWLTETSWREAEWDIEEEAGQQGGPAVDRA